MKERKLLYALGWVKDEYILEMDEAPVRHAHSRIWLIAAVIAALLLAGCAAVVLLKLEDMELRQETQIDAISGTTVVVSELSRQGFAGTISFQAAKEWGDFLKTYDTDHKIWDSLSNADMRMPDEYYAYSCYTKEMTDKIDEICEKYSLNTEGYPHHFENWEGICRVLEVKNLITPWDGLTTHYDHGYIFRSGSFCILTGLISPEWDAEVFLSIRCVAKTDFDEDLLTVQNTADFQQWGHTMPDGSQVLLALNGEEGYLVADRQDYFATVTFGRNGNDLWPDWLTREDMERLADIFDFSFPLRPINDEEWDALDKQIQEDEAIRHPMKPLGYIPDASYNDRVRFQLEDKPHPERLQYAFMDIDGDGREELLIGRDDLICHIYTTDGTNVYNLPFFRMVKPVPVKATLFDETATTNAPTYIEICEGNKVLYVFEYTDGTFIYAIAEPSDLFMDFTAIYETDPENGIYNTLDPESFNSTPTTQSAVEATMDALIPIEVEMCPLSEYPLT